MVPGADEFELLGKPVSRTESVQMKYRRMQAMMTSDDVVELEERVAIKIDSGINENDAIEQALKEYNTGRCV